MADAPAFQERRDFFIDGEWVAARGRNSIEVVAANTEEPLGRVSDASAAAIDRAAAAARRAFDSGPFPDWSPAERAEALARLSKALQSRGPQLAELISRENGCPAQQSLGVQVFSATVVLDSYAEYARSSSFVEDRPGAIGNRVRVRRHPVGVVAAVIPWNVSLFVAAVKIGPAR